MQASDYATLIVAVMTIFGGFATAVRWMVKHYLNELKPNGGSSIKDSVSRLESKVQILNDLVMELIKK
jgi:H+/Cl- antiporter ClcA